MKKTAQILKYLALSFAFSAPLRFINDFTAKTQRRKGDSRRQDTLKVSDALARTFTIFILFFCLSVGYTQNFPVRITPVLTPPYTPYLTDYTDPVSNKLTLQVILNDITVPTYQCKLRLTIEGVNVTIRSNPNYIPPPILLQGGVPQLIYGSDISDYFKTSNLVFQGLNPNDINNNGGRLPEGIYRFTFEVLDYNRNTVVSNAGFAMAWMILNDPPLINMPINNAKVKPINPQNLVFQWTPRHSGSPNAAFTTEYDVKLVEIWPKGRNPYDAINALPPIYEVTTSNTLIVYGPAETPLVLGREYAFQVRARDTGGKDLFKNNGYSEVVRFVYGDECPIPTSLMAEEIGVNRARMRWQGSGLNTGYILRYREKKEDAHWFEERISNTYVNATGLRPGANYEYEVCGECEAFQSEFTTTKDLSTLAENPNAFVCGNPNAIPPITPGPPLQLLLTNDSIHAGGFDIIVSQATFNNPTFSGTGIAEIPWFNGAKVRVTFDGITVNQNHQLTSGEIKTVWDPTSKSMYVDEKTLAEGNDPSGDFNSDVLTFEPDSVITIEGIIITVSNDPLGGIIIETNNGSVALEKGTSYAVIDEAGNGYLIDEQGNIKKTSAQDAQLAASKASRSYTSDPNLKVTFSRTSNTKFGFDEPQQVLQQNYQKVSNGDMVPWKALSSTQPDEVGAQLPDGLSKDRIRYEISPGGQTIIPTSSEGQLNKLQLNGKSNGTIEELLAYYSESDTSENEQVASKLNLVSYDPIQRNVVIIKVNGSTFNVSGLQQKLNEVYSQAVVQWTVTSATETISVAGIDANNLDDGGSGLLSNYTEDMKQVLRKYTDTHTLASETYYLFIVNNSSSKTKLGYMPRHKQAGFIFSGAHNNPDAIYTTIAHELGHGAFHLKHTFSEYAIPQGITDNLMDYPAKSRLDKWQWDYIHNPETVIGLFEDDEEGALVGSDPIIAYIIEKARVLSLTNQDVVAIVHCKACTSQTGPTKSIYSINTEFAGIVHNTEKFQVPGSLCFSVFYKKDQQTEKIMAGLNPNDSVIYFENGSKLSVIFANQQELDCIDFVDDLDSYLKCDQSDTNQLPVEYIDKLYVQIKKCLDENPESIFNQVKEELKVVLNNDFYSNVKTCIRLYDDNNDETLSRENQSTAECELFIDIKLIYNSDGELVDTETEIRAADTYLASYTNRWDNEASLRGINTSAEELRQQVIQDLQAAETNQSFYNRFIKSFSGLFKRGIANFAEGVIVSQKIAKNVWSDGEINKSTWHTSNPDHDKWPAYVRFQPLIGGGTDGVIDEVVGIPMAIKGIYGIATDDEQKQAFLGLFSQEGFNQLWQGVKSEASEITSDADRAQHFGSKTAVQAATMFVPGMQITKAGAVTGVLKKVSNGFTSIVNPRVLEVLEKLKAANKYKPEILKSIEDFVSRLDPRIVDKLANVTNFDKVLADMAAHWNKFHGGKFVLEYFGSKIDDLGGKLSFEIKQAIKHIDGTEVARVYDGIVEKAGGIVRYEMKNWSGWYPSTIKTQFIRDLQNINNLDELRWVFNSTSGVNKGNLKTKFLETLKKVDGSPVDELVSNLDEIKVKQLFPIDNLINESNYAQRVLKNLEKDEVFNVLFEIVE